MRNLGLVFCLVVTELFLQGCDPAVHYSISIKSRELSLGNIDNRKAEAIKIVESILKQHEFTPNQRNAEGVLLDMYKNTKHTQIQIGVYSEDDVIKIYTIEWATFKMTDEAWELENEIADTLNLSLKDCCIIVRDSKYSGRQMNGHQK
jgi:hypothetical protein